MNRNLANLAALGALLAGAPPIAAQPTAAPPTAAPPAAAPPAAAPPSCKFVKNELTVTGRSFNLVATLENPPKTRVTLSINNRSGFHRELVWDPAVGDGLQHDVLLPRSKANEPYTVMAFAEDDRIQTAQVVVANTTQFTTCTPRLDPAASNGTQLEPCLPVTSDKDKPDKHRSAKEKAAMEKAAMEPCLCPNDMKPHETILRSSIRTTTVVVGAVGQDVKDRGPDNWTPRLKLVCNSDKEEISKLQLNRKELFAASVARGFLDQAAPTAVTDTLALVAEIAVERAKSGAFELVTQRFVEPICRELNLRLLGLGGTDRAFPRTCAMLSNMRLEDLLSSGRSLVESARDDVRLTLLPLLITKIKIPSAARDLAVLALRLGNELLDGGGIDVADLDLLVTQLDHSFLRGAAASFESFKTGFINDALSIAAADQLKEQIIKEALERALPDDPGALRSENVKQTAKELELAAALNLSATDECRRLKDTKRAYIEADRSKCIGALTSKLVAGDWLTTLVKILSLDEVVGLVSAARRVGNGTDFETWLEEKSKALDFAQIKNLKAKVPDELKRSCAVRVAIAVVKWCSRRDSCSASDIVTAIDDPEALFGAPKKPAVPNPEPEPEWLCWTEHEKLELPAVRTVYVELASRALAFLTPAPKGEERKRVQAVVRWMFDLASSMEPAGGDSQLQKLEKIVELFEQRDYLRAISQTVALALELRKCTDADCVPDELKKAMSLLGVVASYLRVYEETATRDPAEAKAARKKAIENLIDSSSDRRQRGGDRIFSLGVPVGVSLGYRWTPGTSASGYESANFGDAYQKERAFAWRLPLGLALQHLRSRNSFLSGYHLGVTFVDLGNFARGDANGEADKVRWNDFLQIGSQTGVLFGNRRHSVVLALDVAWSPGVYQRNVLVDVPEAPTTKTLSGAFMAGITLAYYVPIFDFN